MYILNIIAKNREHKEVIPVGKSIDFSKTVYELWRESPEIIDIMKDLGFESTTSQIMLNTAGRVMTIPKGAIMKGIELKKIKDEFTKKGYNIKE